MKRNRFYIKKLNITETGPGTPSNWAIIDRETNRIVDTAESQYGARQTASLYNAGVFKVQEKD